MKNKSKFIAILFICLFGTPLISQVKFSPKVGINISALDVELDQERLDAREGWNVGFDLRIGKGALLVHPGFHYLETTADLIKGILDDDNESLMFSKRTKIRSIKTPIDVAFMLTGGEGILNLHVRGGITPTFIMDINKKDDFEIKKEDLNTFQLGLNAGAGIDVFVATLDFSYEWGLTNFFKDQPGKNRMATITLGLVL